MAESGGGRWTGRPVRCPKCDDLLPDLADLTTHRCRGPAAAFRDSPWERNSTGLNSREEQGRLGLNPDAASRRRPTSRSDDAVPAFCRMPPEDKMRSKKTNQSRIHEAEFASKDSSMLLRQLDELRDRISRSSEFVGKPIWKLPAPTERPIWYSSPEFTSNPRERVGVSGAYSSGLNNDHGTSRKEYLHGQFDADHRKYKLLPERVTPCSNTDEEHNEKVTRAASSKTKRLHPCRAFAGATPFVICSSCFELLKLPQVILLVSKKLSKLRCGSCSEVLCIELTGNRLVVSSCSTIPEAIASSHVKVNRHERYTAQTSTKSDDSSFSEEHGGNSSSHLTSSHELMERESIDLTYLEKLKGISVASDRSEIVENPDSIVVSDVADLPIQDNLTFSLSSPKSISESGSQKEHSDEEITISNSDKFDQSYEKGEAITEIDLSVNDYSISSQDYHGIEKHQNQTFIDKTDDSLVLNTSLGDTTRINLPARDERSQVWVNSHPIPDHLVWKAEKKAGTIVPGEYWYDRYAGFWGVMGQPCLGIIPPFIEEFDYPMPENCAGGNTGVLLNRRELHRKDLNMLVTRGFPLSAGRSYLLDFSGNLSAEISGVHLANFGKLAPTKVVIKHLACKYQNFLRVNKRQQAYQMFELLVSGLVLQFQYMNESSELFLALDSSHYLSHPSFRQSGEDGTGIWHESSKVHCEIDRQARRAC
ncbi:hypothetical protein ZIOFF_017362 [Zingiber officinale]|uniref:Zinc-ribbon domain-containing protein n=1 Tax=Zingiber officinale TaxID=94328 RepID=A0A8J5H4V0_ZINOF|nr:hypothetical protein ZIOFF_017362 [Zingiber officinale]